jgi:hypothetical protein
LFHSKWWTGLIRTTNNTQTHWSITFRHPCFLKKPGFINSISFIYQTNFNCIVNIRC